MAEKHQNLGVTFDPSKSAIYDNYTVMQLTNLWADITLRVGTDVMKNNLSLGVPDTAEILVAFPRNGKEVKSEDLPEGVILFEEVIDMLKTAVLGHYEVKKAVQALDIKGDF